MTEQSKARVQKAAKLLEKDAYATVIMAGWRSVFSLRHLSRSEAHHMREYAHELGVPRERILTEEESVDTITNALFVMSRYLRPRKWRDVVIVTSEYHIARARMIFTSVLGRGYTVRFASARSGLPFATLARNMHHEAFVILMMDHLWIILIEIVRAIVRLSGTTIDVLTGQHNRAQTWLSSIMYFFLRLSLAIVGIFASFLSKMLRIMAIVAHGMFFALYTITPRFFTSIIRGVSAVVEPRLNKIVILIAHIMPFVRTRRSHPSISYIEEKARRVR